MLVKTNYEFMGSLCNTEKLFKWASQNGVTQLVHSNDNLIGVPEFLDMGTKYNIETPIALHKDNYLYVACNTSEYMDLIRFYNGIGDANNLKCIPFDPHNVLYTVPNTKHAESLWPTIRAISLKSTCDNIMHLTSPSMDMWLNENVPKTSFECDKIKIPYKLRLPKFCDDAKNYLKSEALKGLHNKNLDSNPEYTSRLSYELDVILNADLESYFLIVADYVRWARSQVLVGPGRGSAAGCLLSYCLDITTLDPIEHGLFFERFYNAGRNTPGKISLPDIDVDFPVNFRETIIRYITNKYGADKVKNVCTVSRLQGRSIISDILRVNKATDFNTIKSITEHIPDEGRISDDLQEMVDAGEQKSIVLWALKNHSKELEEYVQYDKNGMRGAYKFWFELGLALEGTPKNTGVHASAIIISDEPINETCPLIKDTHNNEICGQEYTKLESYGYAKMDILGLACLDKIMGVQKLLNGEKL